jgi:DNA-binding response OmpR family regulator
VSDVETVGRYFNGRDTRADRVVSSEINTNPTVLVVDDEEDVADAYALKLRDEYNTEVAYGGEEALEKVGVHTSAVLLDRRMPDIHGDDVLDEMRERDIDCPVIMVTAVDPDLNILEMDFDDYLCKPVDQETLLSTLDQHIRSTTSDPRLEEFFSILSKLTVLEEEHPPGELEDNEEFRSLKKRAMALSNDLRESMDNFEEIVQTHQSVNRGSA